MQNMHIANQRKQWLIHKLSTIKFKKLFFLKKKVSFDVMMVIP